MPHLLEVRDLVTRFYTEDGTVHAVNGISYTLDEGESLGIVGESGSGKTVGVLSLMGLIPDPPGRVERGEVFFADNDLLKLSADQLRAIRGREIAMIFQDPMTSLNPVLTVGYQIAEIMRPHLNLLPEADCRTNNRTDGVGGHPQRRQPTQGFSAPVFRGPAPTHYDCHEPGLQSLRTHRR